MIKFVSVLLLFVVFQYCSSITQASKICVVNDAGFVMNFNIKDFMNNQHSPGSGNYPIDQSRCIYMKSIPQVSVGDVCICEVHAILGETNDCSTAVVYQENNETATFQCTGTTLDYGCKLL